MQITYQVCGADLSKKLTGKNIQDYNPWAHLIWRKLKVNKILFSANSDKTNYVLSQIEAPIWDKINIWVIIQGDLLTVDEMFAEVENYMDITQHDCTEKNCLLHGKPCIEFAVDCKLKQEIESNKLIAGSDIDIQQVSAKYFFEWLKRKTIKAIYGYQGLAPITA